MTPNQISSLPSNLRRFEILPDGCWHWTGPVRPDGYGHFMLGGRGGKRIRIHRYYYELVNGELPPDTILHHTCGMAWCVNPQHLEPISRADHAVLHHTKLSEAMLQEMFKDWASGAFEAYWQIGKKYGIDAGYARKLLTHNYVRKEA